MIVVCESVLLPLNFSCWYTNSKIVRKPEYLLQDLFAITTGHKTQCKASIQPCHVFSLWIAPHWRRFMPPAKKEYLQQAGILNMKLGLFFCFFLTFQRRSQWLLYGQHIRAGWQPACSITTQGLDVILGHCSSLTLRENEALLWVPSSLISSPSALLSLVMPDLNTACRCECRTFCLAFAQGCRRFWWVTSHALNSVSCGNK